MDHVAPTPGAPTPGSPALDAAAHGDEYLDADTLGTPHMLARRQGPVGWMLFNNPARHNAVRLEMWAAIPRILQAFDADPTIRVIAVSGTGDRAFVSGADISQFEQHRSGPKAVAAYDQVAEHATAALKSTPKPTVAVIRGWCIGGGVGIAVSCDLRWATETATFGIPAGRLGLGYGMSGVKTLMDLVGPARTKDLFFTARHVPAPEALAMGLIDRIISASDLLGTAQAHLETIAANAPLTLRTLKATVAALADGAPVDDPSIAAMVAACFDSADYAEGRRAFMKNRPPVFTGT